MTGFWLGAAAGAATTALLVFTWALCRAAATPAPARPDTAPVEPKLRLLPPPASERPDR